MNGVAILNALLSTQSLFVAIDAKSLAAGLAARRIHAAGVERLRLAVVGAILLSRPDAAIPAIVLFVPAAGRLAVAAGWFRIELLIAGRGFAAIVRPRLSRLTLATTDGGTKLVDLAIQLIDLPLQVVHLIHQIALVAPRTALAAGVTLKIRTAPIPGATLSTLAALGILAGVAKLGAIGLPLIATLGAHAAIAEHERFPARLEFAAHRTLLIISPDLQFDFLARLHVANLRNELLSRPHALSVEMRDPISRAKAHFLGRAAWVNAHHHNAFLLRATRFAKRDAQTTLSTLSSAGGLLVALIREATLAAVRVVAPLVSRHREVVAVTPLAIAARALVLLPLSLLPLSLIAIAPLITFRLIATLRVALRIILTVRLALIAIVRALVLLLLGKSAAGRNSQREASH